MTADDRRSLVRAGAADLGIGPFAVRSSGIAEDGAERSFAGMYESVLDVSADDLPAATDRCLASAHGPRVAEYEPASDGRMAVIIQRMVAPAAAGVASPPIRSTGIGAPASSPRCAAPGSGSCPGRPSVTNGSSVTIVATPRRQPEHAIDRRQAMQVAGEARRIADARGTPQDIEWAIDADGTLWIVQARPMTALPPDVSWERPRPAPTPAAIDSASGSPSR